MFSTNYRDSLTSKVVSIISAFVLVVGVFPAVASAAPNNDIEIDWVRLNGSSTATVTSGATVAVSLQVERDGSGDSNDWRSTSYRIESGSYTCVNTVDYTSGEGTSTDSFNITAPTTAGTYDVDVKVFRQENCVSERDSFSGNNNLTVQTPAEITTDSATVDGDSSTTVAPSATISAHVYGLLNDGSSQNAEWEGTQWLIATNLGSMSCANTNDMDDSVSGVDMDDVTFNITAPATPGTYNAYFQIAENDDCSGDLGGVITLTNAVIVEEPAPVDVCPSVDGVQTEGPCENESCTEPNTWNVNTQHCDSPLDVCEGIPEMEIGPDCEEILCLAQVGTIWDEVDGCVNPIDTEEECLEAEGYWNGEECEDLVTECPDGQHVENNECVNDDVVPADGDGDGVTDGEDNCPSVANPEQEDTDENGTGDACENEEENQTPAETPAPAETFAGVNSICNNNMDDDNDGLYDENDPGCENDEDSSEENGPIGGAGEGEVEGAETQACSAILNSHLGLNGQANDPEAVKVVQEFLNKELGLSLEVNGEYDAATIEAVKAFQTKYSTDVLGPWGITDATGIVFKTTQRMINVLSCPGLDLPIPELN